jgi:hypothetical protein
MLLGRLGSTAPVEDEVDCEADESYDGKSTECDSRNDEAARTEWQNVEL